MTSSREGDGVHGGRGKEPEPELVMPFTVCVSQGGVYDDAAFVAGWEAGAIDALLRAAAGYPVRLERWVPVDLVPQLDLVAMRRGYVLWQREVDEAGAWARIEIGPPAGPPTSGV